MSGIRNIFSSLIILFTYSFLIHNMNEESPAVKKKPSYRKNLYLGKGRGRNVFPCISYQTCHLNTQTHRPTCSVFEVVRIGLFGEDLLQRVRFNAAPVSIPCEDGETKIVISRSRFRGHVDLSPLRKTQTESPAAPTKPTPNPWGGWPLLTRV